MGTKVLAMLVIYENQVVEAIKLLTENGIYRFLIEENGINPVDGSKFYIVGYFLNMDQAKLAKEISEKLNPDGYFRDYDNLI
jgi:hypothetical protein